MGFVSHYPGDFLVSARAQKTYDFSNAFSNLYRQYHHVYSVVVLMFTLLSYNIYLGKKLKAVLDWISAMEKKHCTNDIICFQEFPYDKVSSFISSRKIKTGYCFAPSIYGKKKVYGQLTIFNKNKLELIKSAELPLGSSRIEKKVVQLFKHATKRKSLLTLFETNTHTQLMVANTHLTSVAFNGHRRNQLEKICREIQNSPHALIVGDLNYTSVLPRFSLTRLIKKYQFEDATKKLKTHRILFMKHQLDYIFAKAVNVGPVITEQLPFSDHYPLMAKFEI